MNRNTKFKVFRVIFVSSLLIWFSTELFWYLNVPKWKADFCFENRTGINFSQVNDAQFSHEWINSSSRYLQDQNGFHIVTNIVLVNHKFYNKLLRYKSTKIPSKKQYKKRQLEIEETLQDNLNNNKVIAVHVLFYHPDVAQYLLNLPLKNSSKLVLHSTCQDPTERANFEYIQRYLKWKTVILMHMDISLGGGWDKINFQFLKTKRLLYALTRYSITNKRNCDAATYATCHNDSQYTGSHDAFVFYVDRDFPLYMLDELDTFGPNSAGIENVLIWYFQNTMKYKVLNPCRTLIIYHRHCIPIRNIERKRFNENGKSGLAPFTEHLV